MSSLESIERARMVEAARRKKESEKAVREETQRRIAELASEKLAKAEFLKQAKATATKQAEAEKEAAKPGQDECVLQIRLETGSTVKHSFRNDDTLQAVYDFVQSQRSSSDPFSLTTQYPRKSYEVGTPDMQVTLKAAGLAPRGQIAVKLASASGENAVRQGTDSSDLRAMYFNKFMHIAQSKNLAGAAYAPSSHAVVLVEFFANGMSCAEELEGTLEAFPEVFFGKVAAEKNNEIVTRYGVKKCPTYLIFKGVDMITQIYGPDSRSIESELGKLQGLVRDPNAPPRDSDVVPDAPEVKDYSDAVVYDRNEKIAINRDVSQRFRVRLVGSPAQGLSWKYLKQGQSSSMTLLDSSYEGFNKEAPPDVYGTDGNFVFTFQYAAGAEQTPKLSFQYGREWMPFADPIDVYEARVELV